MRRQFESYLNRHPSSIRLSCVYLGIYRHVRNAQLTPHEGCPRLLGDRLKLNEIPELPFTHFNLSNLMLQRSIANGRQPCLICFAEHFLWQCLFHGRGSSLFSELDKL